MGAAALLVLAAAFAFPDEQGTRLLSTTDIAKPEMLQVAACSGGEQVPVRFERRQVEGPDSTGRQWPGNFAHTAGAVFRVAKGSISADATCLLAEESFFAGASLITLARPPEGARCSKAEYPTFQADKGRPVVGCWPIAHSGATRVAIIEFSRRLSQALASLVVVDGERRMYVDYPADFKGPGADLWRVDDGGEIHADRFDVVFLFRRGSTYFLAVDWAGTEGKALSLHVSDDASQFREVVSDSWYRSPL